MTDSRLTEPCSTHCSNVGHYAAPRWTSPCCYAEMEDAKSEGTHECPDCGRQIECTIDQVPSYNAELVEHEEAGA